MRPESDSNDECPDGIPAVDLSRRCRCRPLPETPEYSSADMRPMFEPSACTRHVNAADFFGVPSNTLFLGTDEEFAAERARRPDATLYHLKLQVRPEGCNTWPVWGIDPISRFVELEGRRYRPCPHGHDGAFVTINGTDYALPGEPIQLDVRPDVGQYYIDPDQIERERHEAWEAGELAAKLRPRPWLRPALDATRRAMAGELFRAITERARRRRRGRLVARCILGLIVLAHLVAWLWGAV